MTSDGMVAEAATRIFRDLCDPQTLNRAADESWQAPAWAALEDAGLTLAWVPAELGGAGAEVADGFAVLREAGRFAVALPVAETMLAGWILTRVRISSPRGAMSCTTRAGRPIGLAANGTLSGRVRAVPFGRGARHVVVMAQRESGHWAVVLIDMSGVQTSSGTSLAGDPLDTVILDGVRPVAVKDAPPGLHDEALLMGATARAMQMAGALEAILEASVSYANERVAFERPIAKFQAVQHNLARLAGEVAVAMAAAGSAADAVATFYSPSPGGERSGLGGSPAANVLQSPPPSPTRGEGEEAVFLEAAAAKIRVGEAAGEGAGIAHQVLGAIGFTKEHTLHRFTQRLWAWRDDFGNESYWAVKLGNHVAANGADALWPMLAAR